MKRFWVLAGIAIGASAFACIGSMLNGVHFNDGQPDFGSPPPPIVITSWGEEQTRAGATQYGDQDAYLADRNWEAREAADKVAEEHRQALRKDGMAKEAAGDFSGARAAYQELLKYGKVEDSESILDRLEVMREAQTPSPQVMEYLSVRRALAAAQPSESSYGADRDKADAAEKVVRGQARESFKRILQSPVAGFLKAHAQYSLASLDFDARDWPAAIAGYKQAASLGGHRRERALIMAARSLLWAQDPPNDKTWEFGGARSDAAVTDAETILASYLREFPEGHFAEAARGLRGRVLYLRKDFPAALAVYLKQLDGTRKPEDQAGVLASIRATSERLSPAQAKAVQEIIAKDPSLLSPYLDYRLYHSGSKAADYAKTLAFTKAILSANPSLKLTPLINARLAEIELLLHDYRSAQAFAEQAIGVPGSGKKDLAHFVRGTCLKVAGNAAGALHEYQAVLETQDSYLDRAARENMALLYERSGQWIEALRQHWALGYDFDVAYLLDLRMDPAAIQSAIEALGAKDPHHDLLVYSLGLRYLRADQLDKARDAFKSIRDESRGKLAQKGSRDYAWNSDDKSDTVDVLYDPLDTANDLMRLRDAAASAVGEAKPKALYGLASYYYSHRNLLLYNAALWQGARNWMLGVTWNPKAALRDDNLAVADHHYAHEALYRARKICLNVAQAYPKSEYAPKALYRAATAGRRLANFNPWWRDRNKVQNLYEDAAKLMDRVAAEYPNDSLAKNAKKYAGVFRQEGKGEEQRLMFNARQ